MPAVGTTVRKNGKAYDSGDVSVSFFGYVEDEFSEITYGTEQEHQLNHSLNNNATSYSMGKKTHSGSISLYMAAARRLEKASNNDLLSIKPFDINVTYVNDDNEIVNDTVTCKFMSQGREVTGEMGLKRSYELLVLGIKFGS
jgi:hypothetical protein